MVTASDPMVVFVGAPERAAALADVLIAMADRGSTAGCSVAALHARYPGLTLAVVVAAGALVAGFRDGTLLIVDRTADRAWSMFEAEAVARRLYHRWVSVAPIDLPRWSITS
jgi:hypothetical protein